MFELAQEAHGVFVAEALGECIFNEGGTRDAVRANVREAVKAFYFDRLAPARPRCIVLHEAGCRAWCATILRIIPNERILCASSAVFLNKLPIGLSLWHK